MLNNIKIIYEDENVLVVDKPAGLIVFPEGNIREKTLINYLIEKYPKLGDIGSPPRYGVVHRLDKDTSGILLVAKTTESLIFLQKQFINREVEKKYICLVEGNIKADSGEIKTLIGRSPSDFRKQVAIPEKERSLPAGRQAITE
ncbi:MAG: RluA family pseudouridine synthase, partial [Nanoarchaeota archaeon]